MVGEARTKTSWRPWHVSVCVFVLAGLAAFHLFKPSEVFLEEPTISELGAWAFVLGMVQVLLVLVPVSLFHPGPGIMYCYKGFPGITTWSAPAVSVVAILAMAFSGFSIGAFFLAEPAPGRQDFVAVALWALGVWLGAIVLVPLRRRLRGDRTT